MRTIIRFFLIFFGVLGAAQNTSSFGRQCLNSHNHMEPTPTLNILSPNCGNTSPYHSNANLYFPQLADEIIFLKLNFIFLTKPDGKGNFEQNNPEHLQAIDDVISNMNYRLLNMEQPIQGCGGFGENNSPTTKMQFVVNKIWRIDPAWDYLYTGFTPCTLPNAPMSCNNFNKVYPDNESEYFYGYYDNDPTIPAGINIVFANNGNVYDQIVNNQNYTVPGRQGWAASQNSSNINFNQKLRQFFPDVFNDYLVKRYYIADNPDPNSPYPNTPWSTVYGWFYYGLAGSILHETGHNFNLPHQYSCFSAIMNPNFGSSRGYFSNLEISTLYFSASTTSVRQYFTQDSFKKTTILSNSNQLWDLNFRLYSNVKVDNNSSLKATCKIIMPPESRVIVKRESNLIIEGADISSANNTSWNGIKIEGNAYGLILPNTKIDNGYFYMYTDNSILPEGKISYNENSNSTDTIRASIFDLENKAVNIFPNPTGDFINIQTDESVKSIKILNLYGKAIQSFNTDLKRIDVRSLSNGIYVLFIELDNKIITRKFIKK